MTRALFWITGLAAAVGGAAMVRRLRDRGTPLPTANDTPASEYDGAVPLRGNGSPRVYPMPNPKPAN